MLIQWISNGKKRVKNRAEPFRLNLQEWMSAADHEREEEEKKRKTTNDSTTLWSDDPEKHGQTFHGEWGRERKRKTRIKRFGRNGKLFASLLSSVHRSLSARLSNVLTSTW